MKLDTRSRTSIETSPNVFLVKNPACPNEFRRGTPSDGLGRERLYNTVVVTTPVLASNRIHTNQTNSGVKKRLYSEDEMTDLVNQFTSLTVAKAQRSEETTSVPSDNVTPLKDCNTTTEKCTSASILKSGLDTKSGIKKVAVEADMVLSSSTNKCADPMKCGSSDTRVDIPSTEPNEEDIPLKQFHCKVDKNNGSKSLGFLEQSVFSSKLKQVVHVKRSVRLMNKNEHST